MVDQHSPAQRREVATPQQPLEVVRVQARRQRLTSRHDTVLPLQVDAQAAHQLVGGLGHGVERRDHRGAGATATG